MVRLKGSSAAGLGFAGPFQFLVVRLKVGHHLQDVEIISISIPCGSIKRINGEEIDFSLLISIPCGSIKRASGKKDWQPYWYFNSLWFD